MVGCLLEFILAIISQYLLPYLPLTSILFLSLLIIADLSANPKDSSAVFTYGLLLFYSLYTVLQSTALEDFEGAKFSKKFVVLLDNNVSKNP